MDNRDIAAGDDAGTLARWVERWEAAIQAASVLNEVSNDSGKARLLVDAPATAHDFGAIERDSGLAIPSGLRRLFSISRAVDATWQFAEGVRPPEPFEAVFSGGCLWSLERLPSQIESYRSWVQAVFPNPEDSYDAVWHDKYPFIDAPNGDVIALDGEGHVIYLSHDDGEGHGFELGKTVFDFLDDWTKLGCPGPEDWQWLPFSASEGAGLDPDGESGRGWRSWFGLQ